MYLFVFFFCICCPALSQERAKAGRNCKTKRDRESPQGGIFSLFSASIGSSSDGMYKRNNLTNQNEKHDFYKSFDGSVLPDV